jgi:tetratricopeptide (TPR) repeat protein
MNTDEHRSNLCLSVFFCGFFLLSAIGCAQVRLDPSDRAYFRGDYEQALKGASRIRAGLLRGILAHRRGQLDAARHEFGRLAAAWDQGALRSGAEAGDAAEALAWLGRFQDANDAFREAVKRAPKDAGLRVRWGRLFLLKHNAAEAATLFGEALKLEPKNSAAATGMAEVLSSRWDAGAERLLDDALTDDPEFVPALVLQARLALEDEKIAKAEDLAHKALSLQPGALEAMAMLAAAAYQRGEEPEIQKRVAAVLERNPRYGEVYWWLAHFAALKRQFQHAANYYQLAVEKDPLLWKAHAELGITWLRLGKDFDAQRSLEIAYQGDPFNVHTVNTLRLMDSFARYEKFETPSFRVKLHQKEAAVLRPYVEELLERSLRTFADAYQFKPPDKVSFEMFPDHEDFAVRTLGVPGLGALGASFGAIVAMDSPAARPAGEFHWGSTLWHEVAHVITLQKTMNRVPRWFTEGLSVFEEYRAGWGDRLDLETIEGLQKNRLVPVAELNKAFIRPSYPGQVQFAYFQAGMLCRYIAEKHGFEKILRLLETFRDNVATEAALEKVLARPAKELDSEFQGWLNEQVGGVVKAIDLDWRRPRPREEVEAEVARRPDNFFARLQLARILREKEPDQALLHAQAATRLFPEHTGRDSGYEIAAAVFLARGQREQAAAELERWVKAGGMDPATSKKYAALLAEMGKAGPAIRVLEGLLYIAPLDLELHQKLGELYLKSARHALAIREYNAALALKPVDMAQAHLDLARALAGAKRNAEARRHLLEALEIAPNFSPAQKLLLELTDREDKS